MLARADGEKRRMRWEGPDNYWKGSWGGTGEWVVIGEGRGKTCDGGTWKDHGGQNLASEGEGEKAEEEWAQKSE